MEKRRPYVAPRLRRITDPAELARVGAFMNEARGIERLCFENAELALALIAERERARTWKRVAKRLWTRHVPGKVGRYGCAARDIRMLRRGR